MQEETTQDLLKFPNKIKFWTYIKELNDDLDFGNTIKLPNFWFYFKGKKYVTRSFKETLTELNKLCYTKFDTKVSIATGSRVTLFVNPRFEIAAEEFEEVVSDEPLILLEDSFEEESIELDLTSGEDLSIDWDYVDSLYDESDKRGSKDLLEEYARKWEVELSKNKSFANMVKDFKEAV
ncbi:hypothetical protein [Pseudoalteromonas phage PH357]|nr:hypothetical protein [Pseudoalteromonas phage PH357]